MREVMEVHMLVEYRKEVIEKAIANVKQLKIYGKNVGNQEIKDIISAICENLYLALKRTIEDLDRTDYIKKYFEQYLPNINQTINTYINVEKGGVSSENSSQFKEKAKQFLLDIEMSSKALYEKLYDDNILDSTINMSVVLDTIKTDNLDYKGINK